MQITNDMYTKQRLHTIHQKQIWANKIKTNFSQEDKNNNNNPLQTNPTDKQVDRKIL